MRTVTKAGTFIAATLMIIGCSDNRVIAPTSRSAPHPLYTVIGADGNPTPSAADRILVDTRQSLQQATSLSAAWALFPGDDHSVASTFRTTGWAFAQDFDGHGTRALRADWIAGSPCSMQTVRIINSFPSPQPKQVYIQWRQFLGRGPNDPGGFGDVNSFAVSSLTCTQDGRQELRVLRSGVGGGAQSEIDHWWSGTGGAPSIETGAGTIAGTEGWTFSPEASTGRAMIITVYLQAETVAGAGDGLVQVWIDGRLFISRANQSLDAYAFDRFELPSQFVGPPRNQSEYFWDVVAWQPSATSGTGGSTVSVSPQSAAITVGQAVQLSASVTDANGTVMSGQTIAWTAANTSIATVDGTGNVTGVAVGTTQIMAASNGATGSATITVGAANVQASGTCANPQPGWIWCDDFEQDRTTQYFEYTNPSGSFVRLAGAGYNGSTSMHATWLTGQVNAGSLKLAFGRNPDPYMRPIDAGTANYREIFWRVYVHTAAGWKANGNEKFSRAMVIARNDWSEAAVGHVWSGSSATSQNYYVIDPVSGTDASGNLLTVGYNDFNHFTWLGAAQGQVPVFGSGAGQWYCVEAHMRLNDAGQSNGVLETWINGTLDAQRTGLNFLGSYNAYGINALFLENYMNNGAPQGQARDYDELVVSTQRIGCISAPPPPPAPVSSVSVTLGSATLAAGQTTQATATLHDASGSVLTGRGITWMSSNPSVATVAASGSSTATVTAVAAGSANIIATSEGVSGQAAFTVSAPTPTAATVAVSPASASVVAGNSTALSVIVRDASGNAISRPVTWQSSNANVASLSATTNSGATVNGVAQGTATVTATADGVSGSSAITVTAPPPPPPPPPPPSGVPAPSASDHILLDTRQTLQQASTLDQAFALFPGGDHTGARGTTVGANGWSFTTNYDGNGTHALRADWAANPGGDDGIRIISYLPTPKPKEMYVQWKTRHGKTAFDPSANGNVDDFPIYPSSQACKRLLVLRDGVGGGDIGRIDYTWTRDIPTTFRVQMNDQNWAVAASSSTYKIADYLYKPYTTTVYIRANSAAGVNDGIYRLWADGNLVINVNGGGPLLNYAFDRWQWPDTCHNMPYAASEYFWDVLVWTPAP